MQRPTKRWRAVAIVAAAVSLFVTSAVWLPSIAAFAVGLGLAVSGLWIFRDNSWRTACLTVAALMISLLGVEVILEMMAPKAVSVGVVKTHTPSEWLPYDKVLGYRPRPNTEVKAVATRGDEIVFRTVYSIDGSGARATPGSAGTGRPYLFIGDSFVFGEGLSDAETLPSQFAREIGSKAPVVNLGVVGYGANHLVRALEAGVYDSYAPNGAAAVITWIIPQQLPRVMGDGGWLGDSPRYVLDGNGPPRFTGSFNDYRFSHPIAWVAELMEQKFRAAAITTRSVDRQQQEA
ncbi:MAG: hypothetical protein ACHQK9_05860, partial [Reyranellales bacterium]